MLIGTRPSGIEWFGARDRKVYRTFVRFSLFESQLWRVKHIGCDSVGGHAVIGL